METPNPSFFKKNIKLLKSLHPDTWVKHDWDNLRPEGMIVFPQGGLPNLELKTPNQQTIYLHSPNPESEASLYLAKVPEESTGVVVLLGIGLGHLAQKIARERPQIRNLLLYEMNAGVFKQALTHVDLSNLLEDQRVTLNIAPFPALEQTISNAAIAIQLEDTHFLKHSPSFTHNPSYHSLSDSLYPIVNKYNVGGATAMKTGPTFLKNRFQNLAAIKHHCLLDELRNKFKNVPAVLVGGGPSLNKNIHQLKAVQDKILIIAVDSTLPALKANGITPHFVSTLDPDEVIYEKMADCAPHLKGVSLLCMLQTATTIPKTFPAKQVFWGLGDSLTEQWLAPLLGAKICTDEAITVANLSLAAAVIMGAEPIVFMGQDLAYTNFETHAAHTVLDNKDFVEELKNKKDDLVWVKSIDGGQVPTDRGFFSAKNHFESLIAKHPNIYINATEGGAHIEGSVPFPLEEVLKKYCENNIKITSLIDDNFKNIRSPKLDIFSTEASKLLKEAKKLKKIICKSKTSTQTVTKQIRNYKKKKQKYFSFQDLPASSKKSLANIDKLNAQIEHNRNFWRILQDITMVGLKESERLKARMAPLRETPNKYLQWLILHLQRFSVIDNCRLNSINFFEEILETLLQNIKHEENLEKEMKETGENEKLLTKLARHYIETESFSLAKPLVESLQGKMKNSASINFYHGCIEAAQRNHAKSVKYFETAQKIDKTISVQIDSFLFSHGDRFLDYAKIYEKTDRNTSLNLLLKGLFFYPSHGDIRKKIEHYAEEDLAKIKTALDEDIEKQNQVFRLISVWQRQLQANKIIESILSNREIADFSYAYACMEDSTNNFQEAFKALKKAISLSPEEGEYHIAMMSILFSAGKFADGINFLQKAINIDKAYACYWEEIGDTLYSAEQFDDAIAAYEKYTYFLSAKYTILKKMGDCYLALGQTEAAHEAFQQAKISAENESYPNPVSMNSTPS